MKTIKNNNESSFEIKKSVFITNIFKVTNLADVENYIKLIKEKYSDATHNCYAYIIDDVKKSSDDNEPGGTAGIPIMETLIKNDLNYVLCVVTRYFGGIKLGSGGLIRAYRKAATTSLQTSNIINLVDGYIIKVLVNYSEQKKLDYLIKDIKYEKVFNEQVEYTIHMSKDKVNLLTDNNVEYEIIEKEKIEIDN